MTIHWTTITAQHLVGPCHLVALAIDANGALTAHYRAKTGQDCRARFHRLAGALSRGEGASEPLRYVLDGDVEVFAHAPPVWEIGPAGPSESPALARRGKRWESEEEDAVVAAFEAGEALKDIAGRFQRTRGAVRSRLVRFGVIEVSGAEGDKRFLRDFEALGVRPERCTARVRVRAARQLLVEQPAAQATERLHAVLQNYPDPTLPPVGLIAARMTAAGPGPDFAVFLDQWSQDQPEEVAQCGLDNAAGV